MGSRAYRPNKACLELAARDPRFARLHEHLGTPSIPQRPSTFETIARSIVYQQLSGAAAGTIFGRLLDKFPDRALEPRALLRKRITTLRGAGLSQAKAESVRDLARHIVDGKLDPKKLRKMPDDEVIETLTQVRGIGPWSAQMHLMFSLARPNVWPVGDLGVRKGLAKYLGLKKVPDQRACEPLGEPYHPYRTVLAYYMWRILDLGDWRGA